MAYDFLGLTNDVNRRLNEVELTSATFANAKGFYAQIKDSVNSALRDVNQTHHEWPFNHVTAEETLSEGVTRYSFPNDASTIDFDTFRIKEDATFGNRTTRLAPLNYDDYLQTYGLHALSQCLVHRMKCHYHYAKMFVNVATNQ